MNGSELRERLCSADPAAALAPLPSDQLTRLMEDTMAAPTDQPRTMYWRTAVAAAAVLAVAGGGWLVGSQRSSQPQAPASPAPAIRISAGSQMVKCRPPEVATLAGSADFAFAGKVAAVAGTQVTFEVSTVYRGPAANRVEVSLDGSSESLMGGSIAVGASYLISSADGALLGCGYSGTSDTPGLAELFRQAF